MSALQKPSRGWLCCRESKDRYGFSLVLHSLDLTDVEKEIIQTRYLSMLENFQKRARQYASLFFVGHFIITVGSLFVPALLSIQNSSYATSHSEFGSQIYWLTFALSLLVTMCNGMITLFKVDKKYYFLNTTMERLRSEGWQYVGLTGRYSGSGSTHQNQFLTFTHHIEKIKMKQVEEEYYKMQEKTETTPPISTAIDLYPLSPDKPLSMMKQAVPGPVQDTVQSLLHAQEVDLRLIRGNTQALLLSDASSSSASSSSASSVSASSASASASSSSASSVSASVSSSSAPLPPTTSVLFLGDQGIGNDVSESA